MRDRDGAGGEYDQSPGKLWTKQSGEMNYMAAEAGTAARGRSYCPAEEAKNSSSETKQRSLSARSKLPSLSRGVASDADWPHLQPLAPRDMPVAPSIVKCPKLLSTI